MKRLMIIFAACFALLSNGARGDAAEECKTRLVAVIMNGVKANYLKTQQISINIKTNDLVGFFVDNIQICREYLARKSSPIKVSNDAGSIVIDWAELREKVDAEIMGPVLARRKALEAEGIKVFNLGKAIPSSLFKSADIWGRCMSVLDLEGFPEKMRDCVGAKENLSADFFRANTHASCLYNILITDIFEKCGKADLVSIAEAGGERTIAFMWDDATPVAVKINIELLMSMLYAPTAIMMTNKLYSVGDVIQKSSISDYGFEKECSDYWVAGTTGGINNKSPVNLAGQRVFSEVGGSKNEYYLDFPDKKLEFKWGRFFPGVVLLDQNKSLEDRVVMYGNISVGVRRAKDFVEALSGTSCSNGMKAYLVDVANAKKLHNGGTAASVGAGIAAGVWAVGDIIARGLSASAIIGNIAAAGSLAGGIAATAGVFGAVPVVGWVVAAAALATAGVVLLVPKEIANQKEVTVIAGPYIVR